MTKFMIIIVSVMQKLISHHKMWFVELNSFKDNYYEYYPY